MMAWTEETGGGFSLVEHPMPPRSLAVAAPQALARGRVQLRGQGTHGRHLGDDVVYAEAGDFVFKPREQWHTFWNDGDEPCRILEIIAPGGFERFFDELGDRGCDGPPDLDAMMALNERYGLEMKPENGSRDLREVRALAPDAGHDGRLEAGRGAGG